MEPKAILKADSRLRVCQKAAADLLECKNHDDFTDTWFTFLTAAKAIYTVLEQGAKVSAKSRQWFGGRANERRHDELLQYVYEARNDDEHGPEPISAHVPGGLAVGVTKPGFSNAVRMDGSNAPGQVMTFRSMDGKPLLIEKREPHVRLTAVRARGNLVYQPPKTHLGRDIANDSPLAIAHLAIAYLEALVGEARGLS